MVAEDAEVFHAVLRRLQDGQRRRGGRRLKTEGEEDDLPFWILLRDLQRIERCTPLRPPPAFASSRSSSPVTRSCRRGSETTPCFNLRYRVVTPPHRETQTGQPARASCDVFGTVFDAVFEDGVSVAAAHFHDLDGRSVDARSYRPFRRCRPACIRHDFICGLPYRRPLPL